MLRPRRASAVDPAMSDAQLLRLARREAAAFQIVYERHSDALFRFFLRRTQDREASLDLTAETFARAWLRHEHFKDQANGSAAPWLFGIGRRVLAASVRNRLLETEARTQLQMTYRSSDTTNPEPRWLDGLDQALDGLAPAHRQAVELRIVQEQSYQEIAEGLRCSETAARIRVSRGLSALRKAMEGGWR